MALDKNLQNAPDLTRVTLEVEGNEKEVEVQQEE